VFRFPNHKQTRLITEIEPLLEMLCFIKGNMSMDNGQKIKNSCNEHLSETFGNCLNCEVMDDK